MAESQPKGTQPKGNRFFKLLRRGGGKGAKAQRSVADDGALWAAHDRATGAAHTAGEATHRIATSVAKQRSSIDAAADQARTIRARGDDSERTLARVADTFERLSLVALNAGLEGVRLGDVVGRPLSLVSDDVRGHAERGAETVRELTLALRDTLRELGAIAERFDDARAQAAEIAQEVAKAQTASSEGERALGELGDRMRKATGTDPETAKAIAQATEHARALVTALGALSGRVPRALLTSALRPMLEPLVRALFEDELADDDGADAP